jgi:phosphoribosylformylglycinamidine synthase PurS subunit
LLILARQVTDESQSLCKLEIRRARSAGQSHPAFSRTARFSGISDVRQGKYFEISLDGSGQQQALESVEKMAREVLSNPIIEDYRVEIEA